MSSTNWKSELKRRIEDIKQKKESADAKRGGGSERIISRPASASKVLERNKAVADVKAAMGKFDDNESQTVNNLEGFPGSSSKQPNISEQQKRKAPDSQPEIITTTDKIKSDFKNSDADVAQVEISNQTIEEIEATAEAEQQSLSSGLDEPTLFSALAEPEVEDSAAQAEYDHSESTRNRKQSSGSTAAPIASDEVDEMDSYVSVHPESNKDLANEDQLDDSAEQPVSVTRITTTRNSRRFYASLLDASIILGVLALLVLTASLLLGVGPVQLVMQSPIPFTSLFFSLHFIYYVVFTATTGQTIGKKIAGVRLTTKNNGIIGVVRASARWWFQLLTIVPVAIGYFWMFIDREGRTIADIVFRMQLEEIND